MVSSARTEIERQDVQMPISRSVVGFLRPTIGHVLPHKVHRQKDLLVTKWIFHPLQRTFICMRGQETVQTGRHVAQWTSARPMPGNNSSPKFLQHLLTSLENLFNSNIRQARWLI